jgi:hypothetical protein
MCLDQSQIVLNSKSTTEWQLSKYHGQYAERINIHKSIYTFCYILFGTVNNGQIPETN